MADQPTLLTQPFAENGDKNVIPNTTAQSGAFSQDKGFPAETSLPLGAGGVAPSRQDFNGAFNMLSRLAFYQQKGWTWHFDETQDYYAGCIVIDDTDGKMYRCINDVTAGGDVPSADTTNWTEESFDAYTKTVNSPMFNKRDIIAISGSYTAPVTGWYKITVKGGGGGGSRAISASEYVSSGSGGGEGGTTIIYSRLTAGVAVPVIIGGGGTGGYNGGNGGDSQVTINGTTYIGGGGGGGGEGGIGGIGGVGTVNGCCGMQHESYFSSGGTIMGGGGGGAGGAVSSVTSTPTKATQGGGGAGGSRINGVGSFYGGDGGDGYVWFEYFDPSLN